MKQKSLKTGLFLLLSLNVGLGLPLHAAEGISFEGGLTGDALWNLDGGIETGESLLGNLDLMLTADTAELGWWANGTFFFYVLGNTSGDDLPTELVGDIQATSNIEADEAIKLYEAWYEHQFANGGFSLLVGLHDYNSEFDALEHAGLFLNSSFGISPDISQVGPSIFPTTAVGLRGRAQLSEKSYLLAAVYDGVPGDPDNPRGTHIQFDDGDGAFYALEYGMVESEPGDADYCKFALGGWLHTTEIQDFEGNEEDLNSGIYAIAEGNLNPETGFFLQGGVADDAINQVAWYVGGGVTMTGVVPGRQQDPVGLGVAVAGMSDDFRDENPGFDSTETAIELTWQIAITEQFMIQPDVQYIINPGSEPGLKDAVQIGFRSMVSF